MFQQLLQTSKFFVADVANESSWEIFERIANIAKNDTFITAMKKNIFKRNISQLALVALKSTWRCVTGCVRQHRFCIGKSRLAELALKKFCDENHSNEFIDLKLARRLWTT